LVEPLGPDAIYAACFTAAMRNARNGHRRMVANNGWKKKSVMALRDTRKK